MLDPIDLAAVRADVAYYYDPYGPLGVDGCGLARHCTALADEVERLNGCVLKYEQRLEIDHAYHTEKIDGKTELVRHEIPPPERSEFPDGIKCRDITIAALESDRDALAAEVKRLRGVNSDDADPITADWLKSIGFVNPNICATGCFDIGDSGVGLRWRPSRPRDLHITNGVNEGEGIRIYREVITRSYIRRLMDALDISPRIPDPETP